MTATPFPLQWPAGRPRRKQWDRKPGRFMKHGQPLTVAGALARLQAELDRIGARYPVVSSNLEVRLDGMPRSGARQPDDRGVAVYFQLNGKPICMPCDTYFDVADNIAAIAAHIEATRAIERHGVATVAEMFTGFQQIPAQPGQRVWWAVLEVSERASRDEIDAAYRRLARERHPDHGGSDTKMAELNVARQQALEARQ
jgi:DnaJ-domain-containing protein 1